MIVLKKLFSVVTATVVAFGMSVTPVFAGSFVPPAQTTTGTAVIQEDGTDTTSDIPVYGYIGPDVVITDGDPGDPDVPPTIEGEPKDINVAVPVKIMWAAFASDEGDVTSPTYYIKNLSYGSYGSKIEISVADFDGANSDAAAVKSGLTLKMIDMDNPTSTVDLLNSSHAYTTGGTAFVTLNQGASPTSLEVWNFSIGGFFGGDFPGMGSASAIDKYQPEYNLTFKFEVV